MSEAYKWISIMSPKATDLKFEDRMSFLFKGPFGFGKTLAALSMAVDGPVWLSYWDKKEPLELLYWFKYRCPEIFKNIEYDVYGSHNAHEYLNKLNRLIKDCPYYGIVNDSVTMMTASAVNWSLGFRNVKDGPKKDELNPAAMKMIPDFDEYKVETSLVTQSLDICRALPCNVIWTAHPLSTLRVEGSGGSMRVSKTNSIVSYGTKVGSLVPGQFTEIYHFSKDTSWDNSKGRANQKYIINTTTVGDEFAKTALGLPEEIDITDRMFWPLWKELVKNSIGNINLG